MPFEAGFYSTCDISVAIAWLQCCFPRIFMASCNSLAPAQLQLAAGRANCHQVEFDGWG